MACPALTNGKRLVKGAVVNRTENCLALLPARRHDAAVERIVEVARKPVGFVLLFLFLILILIVLPSVVAGEKRIVIFRVRIAVVGGGKSLKVDRFVEVLVIVVIVITLIAVL